MRPQLSRLCAVFSAFNSIHSQSLEIPNSHFQFVPMRMFARYNWIVFQLAGAMRSDGEFFTVVKWKKTIARVNARSGSVRSSSSTLNETEWSARLLFLARHERIVNSAQMEQRYYFGYSDDVNRIFCVGNDKKIFFRYNYKGSFSLLREAFLHYR